MPTLSDRLAAALKARGYHADIALFQQKQGFQWERAAADINAATGDPPLAFTTLRRIVLDGADPKVSTLVKICKGLNIKVSELMGE